MIGTLFNAAMIFCIGTQKNQHYESVFLIADPADRIDVSLKCFT